MIQRKWELQYNNNNTGTKNTVTNKKLDQRINLRIQHHKKLQLTLNGNITIHEDVRDSTAGVQTVYEQQAMSLPIQQEPSVCLLLCQPLLHMF